MLRSRTSDIFLSLMPATFFPSSRYSPEVGLSRQPMMFINVVFPEPEGPIMATYSPSSTERVTSLSTGTSSFPWR